MKIKIAITIDDNVHKAIIELASKDDRSISSMINKILKEHISRHKK